MHPVHVLGQARELRLYHDEAEQHDADGLAEKQAEEHAEEHRRGNHGTDIASHEGDVGVREREQRKDAEIHPRVQLALQARGRRNRLARDFGDDRSHFQVAALRRDRHFGLVGLLDVLDGLTRPLEEVAYAHAGTRRNREGEQHACDRGMHARHEHAVPEHHAYQQIRDERVNVQPVHDEQHDHDAAGAGQPEQTRRLAVENSDDHDGDDVIGDSQGGKEHAHAVRHAIAEQCQDAERERDVGCRGDAPSVSAFGIGDVEDGIDHDRREHAAERRDDGQERLADVREFARRHLVFDLQTHEQEEDGHEDVVDDLGDRHRHLVFAEYEPDLEFEEQLEILHRRRVRDDEGRNRGDEHDSRGFGRRIGQREQLAEAALVLARVFVVHARSLLADEFLLLFGPLFEFRDFVDVVLSHVTLPS